MEVVKKENEEKAEPEKDPDLVKFTNQMFVNFRNNPGIGNIAQAKGWGSDEKFKICDLMISITECRELKAFDETIKYLKDAIDDTNKIAKEKDNGAPEKAFTGDEPEVMEFLAVDSGFSIKKLKLKVKVLPEGISPSDLVMARWLIEISKTSGK